MRYLTRSCASAAMVLLLSIVALAPAGCDKKGADVNTRTGEHERTKTGVDVDVNLHPGSGVDVDVNRDKKMGIDVDVDRDKGVDVEINGSKDG